MHIPTYQTCAGLSLPPKSVVKGETLHIIHNTLADEVHAYAAELESCGFTKYDGRELPAGTEKSRNLFYTYIREDAHIFLFFAAALRMVLISVATPGALPAAVPPPYQKRTPVSVTQCSIKSGMCHAVQTADGSFILMDGGVYYKEDAEGLYTFLREKTPAGEKPRIALWLFSHQDVDHVQLATEFMRTYREQVEVAAVAYQFPDLDTVPFSFQDTEEAKADAAALACSIRQNYPDAVFYPLHTGQVYRFPEVEVEILWTSDLLFPHAFMTANCASAAWRMRFAGGKTALFLGDCMHDACRRIAYTYGDYMKSDIFQVTHHGLLGGDKGLYQLIDPAICLWATSEARFSGTLAGQKYQWCLGEGECDYNAWIRDEAVRKREHYHNGETVTLCCE
ncbi:MAG: hypothetical protein E7408_01040 [Ruminococcaceae bacterium]|nr:hypothetical protein [Oscillospiraceae bacterium]